MGTLEINDMVFFARHGCFTEERTIGNKFVVNFRGRTDVSKAAESAIPQRKESSQELPQPKGM